MPPDDLSATTSVSLEGAEDLVAIRDLLLAAFPHAAEADLVEALRNHGKLVSSLVLKRDGVPVGTVQGSAVTLDPDQGRRGLALGPMAVHPDDQRRGHGTELVHRFLDDARARGFDFCVVLGDPAFYGRFGFVTSVDHAMRSTYDVPPEVFMALPFRDDLELEACVVRYEPEFADV